MYKLNPVVLFSSNDTSRNFPAQCPQDGSVSFLDWSKDDLSVYLGPPPSVFPTVCLSVMASGAINPTQVGLVVNPVNWSQVAAIAAESDNQADLQSISLWGAYKAGQAVTGPLIDLFKAAIFTASQINVEARIQLPLTFPLLDAYATANPDAVRLYWGTLKASPPAWLDATAIAYVEGAASLYSIPLV